MAAIWNTGAIWMKFRIYGYFYAKNLLTERHYIFNQTVRQFGFFIEKNDEYYCSYMKWSSNSNKTQYLYIIFYKTIKSLKRNLAQGNFSSKFSKPIAILIWPKLKVLLGAVQFFFYFLLTVFFFFSNKYFFAYLVETETFCNWHFYRAGGRKCRQICSG